MSASDHLSAEQLAMFMPAHEIRSMTGEKSPDRQWFHMPFGNRLHTNGRETANQMWERKAKEAKSERLTSSVKKKGVQKPVRMVPFMGKHILLDGHHRVAAAHSLDPNMLVPVQHE
jgi:hypothetical protein